MIRNVFLVLLITLGCFQFTLAQSGLNKLKLDSLCDLMSQHKKMMFSLSLAEKGIVTYHYNTGFIDSLLTVPVNKTTKYRIGSITKMFTSVMILQLVDEKKIKLDNPLNKYFPKVKNSRNITIEQLLTHQSGLHSFTDDEAYFTYNAQSKTQSEMLALIESLPIDFEPGKKQAYSNTNYVLLGMIIEKITKKTYAENLKFRVVDPLNLADTYVGSQVNYNANEASSFDWKSKAWTAASETDMTIPLGAGCIVSTSTDLTTFIHALFSGRLISKSSFDNMLQLREHFGLGIYTVPFYEHTGYGHNGGIDQFSSQLYYFPGDSFSIAFLCNASRYSLNDFSIGALSCYFNKPYQLPKFSNHEVDPGILFRHQGNYYCESLKLDLVVTLEGEVLVVQASGQPSISLEANSDFVFRYDGAGAVFEFMDEVDGMSNKVLLKQSGMEFIFTRIK